MLGPQPHQITAELADEGVWKPERSEMAAALEAMQAERFQQDLGHAARSGRSTR